jgi:hypothetical protein
MEIRRVIEFNVKFRLPGRSDEDLDSKAKKEISVIQDLLRKELYQVNIEDIGYEVCFEDERQKPNNNGSNNKNGFHNFNRSKKHRR